VPVSAASTARDVVGSDAFEPGAHRVDLQIQRVARQFDTALYLDSQKICTEESVGYHRLE
jgi:hypothetical protein